MVGGWVLDFTRLMLISTQVEVVVKVGVELGNRVGLACLNFCLPLRQLLNFDVTH